MVPAGKFSASVIASFVGKVSGPPGRQPEPCAARSAGDNGKREMERIRHPRRELIFRPFRLVPSCCRGPMMCACAFRLAVRADRNGEVADHVHLRWGRSSSLIWGSVRVCTTVSDQERPG